MLEVAGNVGYAGIALLLVLAAPALLVLAGRAAWSLTGDLSQAPMLELLDVLLLGATSWLLRCKEGEPDEGEGGEQGAAPGRAAEAWG